MKQKIIIGFLIVLLLAVVFLISKDLFKTSTNRCTRSCENTIDKLKAIDSSLICYKEIKQFNPGNTPIQGIAIDEDNKIYITGARQVSVFNTKGDKTGEFQTDSSAHCIAIDNKNIYLGMGNHIEQYNRNGIKLNKWKAFNNKSFVASVAVNGEFVFVADAGNKKLLKYNKQGILLMELGKKDTSKGVYGFVVPSKYFDVAFGAFNDMWVVNPGKHRVENYGNTGEFQSSWGVASMKLEGFAGCCNPAHMAILPTGEFVTYEKGLDRIKIYSPTGKFQCVVAGPGNFKGKSDFHCNQATLVNDLATDADGNIYVLDAYNIVRIFSRK